MGDMDRIEKVHSRQHYKVKMVNLETTKQKHLAK